MMTQMQSKVSEMFTPAAQALEMALQAGAVMQGEALRWWDEMLQEAGSLQQAQRHTQSVMLGLLPNAQQNAGQYLEVLGHSYATSLNVLRRAFEAGQSASYGEAQRRMLDLWQDSLGALRANAHELAQLNMRMVESWAELAEQGMARGAEAAQTVRARAKAMPH